MKLSKQFRSAFIRPPSNQAAPAPAVAAKIGRLLPCRSAASQPGQSARSASTGMLKSLEP